MSAMRGRPAGVRCGVLGVVAASVLVMVLAGAPPAFAEGPWWQLSAGAVPTNLPPGGEGQVVISAVNLGDGSVEAGSSPVTVTDKLPAGLTATAITAGSGEQHQGGPVECSLAPVLSCTFEGSLAPYEELAITITVAVAANAPSGGEDEAAVSGGGAPGATFKGPLTVSGAPTPFGVESYSLVPEEEGGVLDTQAGSHPFQLTTSLKFNETAEEPYQPAQPKDLHFKLPPGLIGNPDPFSQCTDKEFSTVLPTAANECAADTAVGVALVSLYNPGFGGLITVPVPVFNLAPSVGEPARFGFEILKVPVLLDTSVRTGGDYGVTVSVNNITELTGFLGARVTLWGVPGDARHDSSRGWGCLDPFTGEACNAPSSVQAPPPFLALPTSCSGLLQTSMEADSWAQPGDVLTSEYTLQDDAGQVYGMDGCNRLSFEPSISVAPDGQAASTPSGLTVGIRLPQESILTAGGYAQADVKDTTVALPEGVQISPAAADGLESCSLVQVGLESAGVSSCSGSVEGWDGGNHDAVVARSA